MKLQRLDAGRGVLYWFPDATPMGTRAEVAIAGPFADRFAGYWWMAAHLEDRLSPAKKALWADAVQALGARPDVRQLMSLAMGIAAGMSADWVHKAAQPIREESLRPRVDYRTAAAGEREAA